MNRNNLLDSWARHLAEAARNGALTGKPCSISRVETIKGPRAGALEIFAGLESGRLLRALSKSDCATLRQFIPWHFAGDPQAFMSGRYVRCEAGWPSELADSVIRLNDISNKPEGGGRWVAGVNEVGATVIPGLGDKTAHFLVSGATGSGKSVALQSAVLQFSQDTANDIVLVDGKMGESLRAVERLPGIIGPCAIEGPQVRRALGWAASEMRRRYADGYNEVGLSWWWTSFRNSYRMKSLWTCCGSWLLRVEPPTSTLYLPHNTRQSQRSVIRQSAVTWSARLRSTS